MKLYNIKLKYLFVLLAFTAVLTNLILQTYYYVKFDQITKHNADAYFSSIMEQVQGRIETTHKEIQNKSNEIAYSRLLQEYLSSKDKYKTAEYFPLVVDYITNVIHTTNYIKGIRILENQNSYIGTNTEDEFSAITSSIFKEISAEPLFAEEMPKKPLFKGPYLDKEQNKYYYAYVEPIFKTMPGDFSFDPIAIGIFICSSENLQGLVNSISISNRSTLVFSYNDRIISANHQELLGTRLSEAFSPELAQTQLNQNTSKPDTNQLIKLTEMSDRNWKILLSIPISDITTDTAILKKNGLVIGISEMLFFLVAGIILIQLIYKQISHLLADIVKASNYDAKFRLRVRGSNEVGIISRHINGMLNKVEDANLRIFTTQERLYAAELEKKQSEVNALHSQINPHFLYNTLECIRSIAKYRNVDEIARISSSMAHIFRYSIKAGDIVTLKEELDILHHYFNIMNIRFEGRFELITRIEDELLSCQMIKMILQPIVENAFYHGLEKSYDKGILSLTIASDSDNRVVIQIDDNGVGMDPIELLRLKATLAITEQDYAYHGDGRSSGIGLLNITKKIKLIYGWEYGLQIESELDRGTSVMVVIPRIAAAET